MHVTILDLDGALEDQEWAARLDRAAMTSVDLRDWGPRIRIHCGFRAFARFEDELSRRLGGPVDDEPRAGFLGSGDFHHVSLALLRRLPGPVNLLVLDKHSDWVRGAPVLHCGAWLARAGLLRQVEHIIHIGGDVDFDNLFRLAAPWPWIESGRLTVIPAVRSFRGGKWNRVPTQPLVRGQGDRLTEGRMRELAAPLERILVARPLYVSVDKDVLSAEDAAVNWDSGSLRLDVVRMILRVFREVAGGRLAGCDTTGDWSPARMRGLARRFSHLIERRNPRVDPAEAAARNGRVNLALLDEFSRWSEPAWLTPRRLRARPVLNDAPPSRQASPG